MSKFISAIIPGVCITVIGGLLLQYKRKILEKIKSKFESTPKSVAIILFLFIGCGIGLTLGIMLNNQTAKTLFKINNNLHSVIDTLEHDKFLLVKKFVLEMDVEEFKNNLYYTPFSQFLKKQGYNGKNQVEINRLKQEWAVARSGMELVDASRITGISILGSK
jgi:uncharacterized protein YacL